MKAYILRKLRGVPEPYRRIACIHRGNRSVKIARRLEEELACKKYVYKIEVFHPLFPPVWSPFVTLAQRKALTDYCKTTLGRKKKETHETQQTP